MLARLLQLKFSVPLAIASVLALIVIHTAAAYQTNGIIWPDQPAPGECCLRLNVAQDAYYPFDVKGNQNGVTAWNDSAALVEYNWVSMGEDWAVHMTDNYWTDPKQPGLAQFYYDDYGLLVYSVVTLNTYFTETYSAEKIQEVAAHELGHVNGLDDLDSGCVLMNRNAGVVWDECGINAPTQDEIDGVNSLY